MILLALVFAAQTPTPPPVRPIGPIEHVTAESLAVVSHAVPTSAGRVFMNDFESRRVLLYDSSLAHPRVVVDSSSGAANGYGDGPASLVAYRGDSALLISPTTRSMLVLSPAGVVVRAMALPPSGPFSALFDGRGHLVYLVQARATPLASGQPAPRPDSGFVVRFDLGSRTLDTIATLRGPPSQLSFNRDPSGRITGITVTVNPIPTVDDWGTLADGTIAVLRGRDYHVDWFGASGPPSHGPRMAFGWEHLNDDQKRTVSDSAIAALQHTVDSLRDAMIASTTQGGRGGRGDAGPIRQLVAATELSTLPDYRPPIRFGGAVRGDADGNLWIQTSLSHQGRPIYDIVNRNGEVTDRVVLPNNRRIAGFGPGVIYMSVLDSLKVAHLERARIR